MKHFTKLPGMDDVLIISQFIITVWRKMCLSYGLVHFIIQRTKPLSAEAGLLYLSFPLFPRTPSGSVRVDDHQIFTVHIKRSLDLCTHTCPECAALYLKSDDLWLELSSLASPITRPAFGTGAELSFSPCRKESGTRPMAVWVIGKGTWITQRK